MNQILLEQLIKLIAQQSGLIIRPQSRVDFNKKVQTRIKSLKLSGLHDYYSLLHQAISKRSASRAASTGEDYDYALNLKSETEWKILMSMITNGESFFFRDDGQFKLLQERLLPQLIEQKRKANDLSLKIWSAGCSTGEEPYSIAILLRELISDLDSWQILILGTDINQQSLSQARQGIYKNWSFRRITPDLKTKYFQTLPKSQGWQLKPQIRQRVTFKFYNLTQDDFCGNAIIPFDLDLVLCRNVFIYFEPEAIQQAVNKIYSSLKIDGFFISGHAELQEIDLSKFITLSCAESVYYQRHDNSQGQSINQQSVTLTLPTKSSEFMLNDLSNPIEKIDFGLQPISKNPVLPQVKKITLPQKNDLEGKNIVKTELSTPTESSKITLEAIKTSFSTGQYKESIQLAQELIAQQPQCEQAAYLLAQAYANQGELELATEYCQRALTINEISLPVLYLLAQIAEEQNRIDQAKDLLRKIIYLEPDSIPAYLELGSLYSREGNLTKAKKTYDVAYELLKKLSWDTEIEYQGTVTVSKLMNYIQDL
ncbi:methylase of chemotaxis methyl-accepting protein [Xenococcus sp. PCC 7305]|uniref:CheR family methyltransferase n=1 Tax=Xenococcus sp. PCC 7305 TaxID=102125 RepID=UPI0002AC14A1|nr:protein-glutamate O-methyltransferase CheR [Xenococcus sp. PCC 7305]ELS02738.1 methylase of chemotaxis methyl-accepting protein [Xenococcus sp. PCC 7305]